MPIPAALVAEPRWCVWRFNGAEKKVPYRVDDPTRAAQVNDPTGFGPYEAARAAARAGACDGVGFLLGDGWTGVDLDDCFTEGTPSAKAAEIVAALNSYTEVSPSGTGLKIFLRAFVGRNHARKGLEIYGQGRYFTVTGRHLPGTPEEPQQRADELGVLIEREFGHADDDAPRRRRRRAVDDPDLPDDRTVPGGLVEGPLVEGGRNTYLASIAGRLRAQGLSDEALWAALTVVNRERCVPPIDDGELRGIVKSIARYQPNNAEQAIDRMNARHCVVMEAGKTTILTRRVDPKTRRVVYDRSRAEDIRLLYAKDKVPVNNRRTPVGDYWLQHPGRRTYTGLVFDPENTVTDPGVLNLWTGLAVKPAPGDWSLFRAHIRSVLCRDNEEADDFFIKWLARMFQKPGKPALTAIALRGGQGTGKSIVGRFIGSIFGQHALTITHGQHVTGHFNAHLQDAVFVFADEAIAPGDKAGESAMKSLISEPTLFIERKGKDAFSVTNVIHLMLASNHDWVIPANHDERRYLMLNVSSAYANNHAYFGAMIAQMAHGGQAAMLADLLAVDLTGWNHLQPPNTEALTEQKRHGMPPLHQWWFAKLEEGRLMENHPTWLDSVPKTALYADYVDALTRAGVSRRLLESQFWTALQALLPDGYPENHRHRTARANTRMVSFPRLGVCRAQWDERSKTHTNWKADPDGGPKDDALF